MIEWIKKATSKNVTGNYKFYVKSEPQNPDTASTITVSAFTDKNQSAMLPCHYKWFKARNGLTQQSYKFRGNSYVCDASDIGSVIQVEVTSNDPQFSGKAIVQFGPIKLATQIKKHIMDTLANGSTFIRGNICLNDFQEKDCQFKIFQDMIKICHTQSQLNYTFNYSIYEPRIQIASRDQNKIWITFGQNYQGNAHLFLRSLFGNQYNQVVNTTNTQCKMEIRFATKQIRDIFLLTLKAFFTKKQLKNSVIVHKIQQSSFNQNNQLDLLFQIETLRSDISRLYYSSQQKQKEKIRLNQQVTKLEKQIQQIVTTYTRMAEEKFKGNSDLNQSYTVLSTKRDEVFGRKCQNLQRENVNLNQRIKILTAQIDQIRFNTSIANKNQTVANPNFTHITTIRMNQPSMRNQATNFDNILQHLSQSRVTQFSEGSFLSKKLDKANDEKIQLQKKLQKSFKVIDDLQKKLKAQGAANNMTAVNFNLGSRIQMPNQINTSSYSLALDLQRIQSENNRLASLNDNLKKQNKTLKNQLVNTTSKIIIKQVPSQNDNSKISVSRENLLQIQNQGLKKQMIGLKQALNNEEAKSERFIRQKIGLQRKIDELSRQLQMYRKNQEVLNRSQHLSMEMDNYNQQQLKMLKQQNQMLLMQNEKLSKAVQKYMNQAKQNIKLRKEILILKQKQSAKLLNPEKSEIKSIYSKENNSFSVSQIIGRQI